MALAWKIAKRYLISKKSTNAINVISFISAFAMATVAAVIMLFLSAFNGFESVVVSLYNVFYADVSVVPNEGKTFQLSSEDFSEIKALKEVKSASFVLTENALLQYGNRQHIAKIKAVDSNYMSVISNLDNHIIQGDLILENGDRNFMLVGAGIRNKLGINVENPFEQITTYIPRRNASSSVSMDQAFNRKYISPIGVFAVQQEFDSEFVLTPLSFLQELMQYESNEVGALEIKLNDQAGMKDAVTKIQAIVGENLIVKSKYEQNATLYKVMSTEKWVFFFILILIVIIAAFNIVGSLSMLVIEKRQDIATLYALGAQPQLIKRIFLLEGCLLSLSGAFIGILFAVILCVLQQEVGLLKIPGETFLLQYYPVELRWLDFIAVSVSITLISVIASYLPARKAASAEHLSFDQLRTS